MIVREVGDAEMDGGAAQPMVRVAVLLFTLAEPLHQLVTRTQYEVFAVSTGVV
jgi:hypothetical protein